MGKIEYYEKLYHLQDKVLESFAKVGFFGDYYLTGGTAVNRFLYPRNPRFSDDLDFFTKSQSGIKNDVVKVYSLLEKNFSTNIETMADDFCRLTVKENDLTLQLDFVNDLVKRFGENISYKKTIMLDNAYNIFTNKINSIIDRDEEKDVFDLLYIHQREKFDFRQAVNDAQQKGGFNTGDLMLRLKTFPIEWLSKINSDDHILITYMQKNYENIIKEFEFSLENDKVNMLDNDSKKEQV